MCKKLVFGPFPGWDLSLEGDDQVRTSEKQIMEVENDHFENDHFGD